MLSWAGRWVAKAFGSTRARGVRLCVASHVRKVEASVLRDFMRAPSPNASPEHDGPDCCPLLACLRGPRSILCPRARCSHRALCCNAGHTGRPPASSVDLIDIHCLCPCRGEKSTLCPRAQSAAVMLSYIQATCKTGGSKRIGEFQGSCRPNAVPEHHRPD